MADVVEVEVRVVLVASVGEADIVEGADLAVGAEIEEGEKVADGDAAVGEEGGVAAIEVGAGVIDSPNTEVRTTGLQWHEDASSVPRPRRDVKRGLKCRWFSRVEYLYRKDFSATHPECFNSLLMEKYLRDHAIVCDNRMVNSGFISLRIKKFHRKRQCRFCFAQQLEAVLLQQFDDGPL
ncbi:MAG: hypothetical protein AB7Q00_05090 [Phycisphaerales bacterium]